jgi:hypothetical protein
MFERVARTNCNRADGGLTVPSSRDAGFTRPERHIAKAQLRCELNDYFNPFAHQHQNIGNIVAAGDGPHFPPGTGSPYEQTRTRS